MRRIAALGVAALTGAAMGQHIGHVQVRHKGATIHAVVSNLPTEKVTPEAVYSPRLAKPWSLISKRQPKAAITGTFFAWENQQPVADVLIDGELKAQGRRGSYVAVDWFGRVQIRDARFGEEVDWFPYRHALRGGVRLMTDGDINPNPKAQQFRDPRIWGKAARTGIGLTESGKLVMAATGNAVTLSHFAEGMKQVGVTDAIGLDGGGSTMLYYNGRMLVSTGRPLSTMFMVHDIPPMKSAFEKHAKAVTSDK